MRRLTTLTERLAARASLSPDEGRDVRRELEGSPVGSLRASMPYVRFLGIIHLHAAIVRQQVRFDSKSPSKGANSALVDSPRICR